MVDIPSKWSWVDTSDPMFSTALDTIINTDRNLVVVGSGGVGKSVLLKMAADMLPGNTVVLSTTGISAANLAVDGLVTSTVHSFFKFPAVNVYDGMYVKQDLAPLMQAVDTILVDEVSMLNASLMDAMIRTLRLYRRFCEKKLPRMIFFGDVLQLPPVVQDDDPIVCDYFNRRFGGVQMFYASPEWQACAFDTIHMNTIYRQQSTDWQGVLNRLRIGELTAEDFDSINERVVDEKKYIREHEHMMYLVCTNKRAENLNNFYLDTDGGRTYNATVTGKYRRTNTSLLDKVLIAPGMQVMCIHNNREAGYQNGTLGKVLYVTPSNVAIRTANGREILVGYEKWEQYDYIYDALHDKVTHIVSGTFSQIGCKPAFAVTVHKSQSLTLDSVLIDPMGMGSYSPSLAYVALSRCTTKEGVGLTRPLEPRHVKVNREGLEFLSDTYERRGLFG